MDLGRRTEMAKKETKTVEQRDHENRNVKLPRSVAKHIRLLKSQGRLEEADNLRRTTIESRNQSG